MKPTLAIIGAGLSGLSLAYHLKDHAFITLFEKSRGVGGRMSTRYTDLFQFDHGAQFFTARSKVFKTFLKTLIADGLIKEWSPKVITLEKGKKSYKRLWYEPHYVATPKMNSLCKALAKNLHIMFNTNIDQLYQKNNKWYLIDKYLSRHGPFDWIICTAPAPQAKTLLPGISNDFENLSTTVMTGCFCLMLGITAQLPFTWGAATVNNSPISWIAIDSSKPNRENHTSIVIHSTNTWAEEFIEADKNSVSQILIEEFQDLVNISLDNIAYQRLHLWRYANTRVDDDESVEEVEGYIIDPAINLAACGDWCLQGNVESAYLSGFSLAKVLKNTL